VQVGVGIAECEGVEASAENERLADAVVADSRGEDVFGEARTADHEGAERRRERLTRSGRCALEFEAGVGWKDWDSERVFEDERARVMQLVRGAAHGDTKGSA
jgi:hypothetical protein